MKVFLFIVYSCFLLFGGYKLHDINKEEMKPNIDYVVKGDTDKIQVKEVVRYRDRIRIKTVAKDKGQITTEINRYKLLYHHSISMYTNQNLHKMVGYNYRINNSFSGTVFYNYDVRQVNIGITYHFSF
jgi:hypothetical protein